MVYTLPKLSYVGSIDVQTSSSGSSGSTLYNIELDHNLVQSGNILMFEYKYQEKNSGNVIKLDHVNLESTNFQTGISNIWQIFIPCLDNLNTENMEIGVRSYVGLTGSSDIRVSEWSNTLTVYNPPTKQSIYEAFYDSPSLDNDELFVVLNVDSDINYSVVKFIVAYYYSDTSGNAVWKVSGQLSASLFQHGSTNISYRLLHEPNFGKVSTIAQVVYTAVYAVYPYEYDNKNYFAVSHISNTIDAPPATYYSAPKISDINYVYSSTGSASDMKISILKPMASVIPTFTVEYYLLQTKETLSSGVINDWPEEGTGIRITPNSDPTKDTVHDFSTASYTTPNTKLEFKVQAVSANNTLSNMSDVVSKYIFKVSGPVNDLTVVSSSFNDDDDTVNLELSFKRPTDRGYGYPVKYEINVDNGSGGVNTLYEAYSVSATEHTVKINNIYSPKAAVLSVRLLTQDPNDSSKLQPGNNVEIPYIAVNFELNDIVYNIYNHLHNDNKMSFDWLSPVDNTIVGWDVNSYDVYLQVDNNSEGLLGTQGNKDYEHDANEAIGSKLKFRVKANLQNGVTNYSIWSAVIEQNIFVVADAPSGLEDEYATKYVDANGEFVFQDRAVTAGSIGGTVTTFNDNGTGISYANANWKLDDTLVFNSSTVTRLGGSPQNAINQASIDKYFIHSYQIQDLLMQSDAVALDYAQAYTASRAETSVRCDSIELDLYTPNYNTGIIAALELDFFDPIRVVTTQPGGSTLDKTLQIFGVQNVITPNSFRVVFTTLEPVIDSLILNNNIYGTLDYNVLSY